jgi:ABC-2 type transport system permease protein
MTLIRTAAIVVRHFYLMRESPARVVPIFAWIAVDIVLWGFITKYLDKVSAQGFDFVATLLGAVLLWDFFVRIMHGVTLAFFEDVWSRNFLNVFAGPITITEYVFGLILSSVATGAAALIMMVGMASFFFGLSFWVYGLMLAPFLLILFLSGIALGVGACAMVLRFGPACEWFVWPIPALMSPFVGVFYPVSTLPSWMQYVSAFLPQTYVFEGMRAIITGGEPSLNALLWGAMLAALWLPLSYLLFARVYRHAVRSGLIARYSAETAA